MDRMNDSRTRVSLLGRLRRDPTNQEIWAGFVAHYGPKIYSWCRKWKLQEADAQDVTQNVLLKLADKMRTIHYDSSHSFRTWLKTLTYHAWVDFLETRQRPGRGSGDSEVVDMLHSVEACADLVRHLEAEFDREVLEEAMVRVRLRVAPQTWEAFRLTALEGKSCADTAALLQMQVGTVFKAKSKVQQMLREEIERQESEEPIWVSALAVPSSKSS